MIARPEEKERVLYEFDVFRVDPVRRLLLRAEEPVAITPKAFSILLALLEHPGEVVEKAELIERVWPGVFVTEANLTQNIFSLRKCLGERANDNRYIVTVPGQGYSFAGELRRIERSATAEIQIVTDPQEPAPAPRPIPTPADPLPVPVPPTPEPFPRLALTEPPVAVPAPTRPPARRLRRLLIGTGVGVVVLLVTVTAAHIIQHLGPAAPKPQSGPAAGAESVRQAIAVLDFKSLSPNADTRWLQTAFSEMLTTELAAGGKMRVIRGERVAQAVHSLALQDPGSLGTADLQRLHDTLGADLVVVGAFLPIQGQIRLDLRVVQLPAGETVLSLAERGTQQGLFDLVSRTGEKLRDSLGVAALSPKQVQEAQALRPSSSGFVPALYRGARAAARLRFAGRAGVPAAGREGGSRLGGDPLRPVAGLVRAGLRARARSRRPARRSTSAVRCRARSASPSRGASTRRASSGARRARPTGRSGPSSRTTSSMGCNSPRA